MRHIFFLFQLPIVGLIASGVLPRELYILWALVLVGYFLWERLERAFLFFVASLPLFLAMPLAPAFDTTNVWRILVAVLFFKWVYKAFENWRFMPSSPEEFKVQSQKFKVTVQSSKFYLLAGLLLVFSVFSIVLNDAWVVGIKRLLYFLNIFMLVPVVVHLMRSENFFPKLAKAVWVSLAVILFAGYLQLAAVFVVPIDQFIGWWASHVTKTYYGGRLNEYILFDNNWFTYEPGKIPTLRMFSIFHESHAMGLYIILALPFVGCLFWRQFSRHNLLEVEPPAIRLRAFLLSKPFLITFALPLLAVVLTGTRGLWVSALGPVALFLFLTLRKSMAVPRIKLLGALLLLFALLFPLASALGFLEQQAQSLGSGGEDIGAALKRLRSVFDLDETSNVGRLGIWKQTLPAILERPLLGFGLGNFGAIMGSGADLRFSAHNLYLHIAAELGIPALLVVLTLLYFIFQRGLRAAESSEAPNSYALFFLFSFAWVLMANVFDVTLLDQRVLMLFSIGVGALLSL